MKNIEFVKHKANCHCSYCGLGAYPRFGFISMNNTTPIPYGLSIPQNWNSRNSWYVIRLSRTLYFRWKFFKGVL
jgi:hypothetical protein